MTRLTLNPAAILTLASILLIPAISGAESYSVTSLLLQNGGGMRDAQYGNNATDGNVSIVTLEHYGAWEYGDNFFFIDIAGGKLAEPDGSPSGSNTRLYLEFDPRISISNVTGIQLALGPIKDILAAGQINRGGDGFYADLAGIGFALRIPGFDYANLNIYSRKDKYNKPAYQVSADWGTVVPLGPTAILFEGYIDIAGTDTAGADINTQPRLMLDSSALLNLKPGSLWLGTEFYYHHNKNVNSSLPQLALKWTW